MTSRTDLRRRVALGIAALLGLAVVGVLVAATARYVHEHIATSLAPILAAALGVALFVGILYFLWHVLRDPTRRLAENTRDEIDYRVERARVKRELERRVAALDEELRVRALTASARVHESASRAVADAELRRELEELKGRSEAVVMRAQSLEVTRLIARYEAAHLKLDSSPNLTPAEKADLLEELRELLAEDPPAPPSSRSYSRGSR